MAAVTLLGSATFSTASGTKTVVATPAVGDFLVIVQAHTGNTSTNAPTDNNADGAGTYTLINTCVTTSSADTMRAYVRDKPVGSATLTTFTTAPGTSTGGGLAVCKVTGVAKTGTLAIRQSAIQSNQGSGGTPTPALSSAALTTNALVSAVLNASNTGNVTARSSPAWTRIVDGGYNSPASGFDVATINSGETATSIAWGSTSASAFCSIVFEIDTSVPSNLTEPTSFSATAQSQGGLAALGAALGAALVLQFSPPPPAAASVTPTFVAAVQQADTTQAQPRFFGSEALNVYVQPRPQPAQWANASRDLTQPAPVFSGSRLALVPASRPTGPIWLAVPQIDLTLQPWIAGQDAQQRVRPALGPLRVARAQDDTTQIAAVVIAQTIGQRVAPASRAVTAQQQADPTQAQPLFSSAEQQPAPQTQPAPQAAQWSFASRDTTQPAPWIGKTAIQTPPPNRVAVAVQADPSQPQPLFGRKPLATAAVGTPPLAGAWFAAPQTDTRQLAALFNAQPPASAQQPTPQVAQWLYARDTRQIAPWFGKAPPSQSVAPPVRALVTAAPQTDTSQIAPRVWTQQLDFIGMPPGEGAVIPQADPSQIQPIFRGVSFAQSVRPPIGPMEVVPQADPTQTQPTFDGQTAQQRVAPALHAIVVTAQQVDPSQVAPEFIGQTSQQRAAPVGSRQVSAAQVDPSQSQPAFSSQRFAPLVPAAHVVVAQQAPDQALPWFSGQLAQQRMAPPANQTGVARQVDPSQSQPIFSAAPFAPVSATVPPRWIASAPESAAQTQPTVRGAFFAPVPTNWVQSPPAQPDQVQPWVAGQYAQQRTAPPGHPEQVAAPQADPSQTQPALWQAPPPSITPESPALRPIWVAAQQDDPTQLGSVFFQAPPPSQEAHGHGHENDGGGWWPKTKRRTQEEYAEHVRQERMRLGILPAPQVQVPLEQRSVIVQNDLRAYRSLVERYQAEIDSQKRRSAAQSLALKQQQAKAQADALAAAQEIEEIDVAFVAMLLASTDS